MAPAQFALEGLFLLALIGIIGTTTIILPLLSTSYSVLRGLVIWKSSKGSFDDKVDELNKRL